MHPLHLIPLIACVLATAIAAALVSHDPGQRVIRLVATVLACSAWWSLCEVLWNVQDDPDVVVWLIRASGLGWLWLGPLALDIIAELLGDARSRLHRWVPAAYAAAGASVVLYVGTPWCLTEPVRTSWGWSYRFGPLFPLVYAMTLVCFAMVMLYWPKLSNQTVKLERRQAWLLLAGIVIPLSGASLTDVVLPYFDVHLPRVGSASLLTMGGVVAWSVLRHGHFLLAPNAFAWEILATLRDGVALLHADGRIRTANEGLTQLAGRSVESLRDLGILELLPELPRAPSARLVDFETELHPQEGDAIPVSVSSSLLYDEEGKRMGEVLAIHDLREVAALRSRLVTSGRLAAVSELAAGIAHEIANPTSFVRANLMQLRRHWGTLEATAEKLEGEPALEQMLSEGEDLIEESIEGVDRVTAIVRNVGAFSHAGRGRSEQVDVNALLDNAVSVAQLSFSVVVERCYTELPSLSCDPEQLKQVFLNLLLNALQAVGDYGHIRLATDGGSDWITIRIQDDGPGIPEDAIDRIFDPFFTTRPAEGVGLGLAHCHEIVSALGGGISVSSKLGLGATFEIRLPTRA